MSDSVDLVVSAIKVRGETRPCLVAIDGHSAAGKSTLAHAIAQGIVASIVHMDDFYRDLPSEERLRLSPEQGVSRYFDWERLREEALVPLRAQRSATFAAFDWNTGSGLAELRHVSPADVVIVEGVYSARPELSDLIDLRVLVRTNPVERERRRRERHDLWEWEARWDAAEVLYFEHIRPPSAFDLIVDANT